MRGPPPLTLAVGAGDRERFGWVVEKAVELGVTAVVPLETERTAAWRRKIRRAASRASSGARRWRRSSSAARRGPPRSRSRCRSTSSWSSSAPAGSRWLADAAGEPPPAVAGRAGHGRRRSRGRAHRPASGERLVGRGLSPGDPGRRTRSDSRPRRWPRRRPSVAATTTGDAMADCLFCKIVAGEIPATIVKRTDDAVAFRDIDPSAPAHVLVIPTRHVPAVRDARDGEATAGATARASRPRWRAELGLDAGGYRIVTNTGTGRRPERGPSALPRARRAEDELAAGL